MKRHIKKDSGNGYDCVICGKHFAGYPNNAEPVEDGYCCDECNERYVIPMRLKLLKKHTKDAYTLNDKAFYTGDPLEMANFLKNKREEIIILTYDKYAMNSGLATYVAFPISINPADVDICLWNEGLIKRDLEIGEIFYIPKNNSITDVADVEYKYKGRVDLSNADIYENRDAFIIIDDNNGLAGYKLVRKYMYAFRAD